jgi:hypothetical protein
MDENFHIIEQSSLIGAETKKVRRARGQYELALSSFTWSDVIFRSFQAGSLKRLDIDAYFSYSTSVAKRMYRFLDKRFWVKDRWEFNLKEFAFEHIGLSRKYNVAQVKNKLQPAIDELSQDTKERAAFLEVMDPKARYIKLSKGEWLILLSRKTTPSPIAAASEPVPNPGGLEAELVRRGVTPDVAHELVAHNPPEQVALRLEVFDWLIEKKNSRVIKESPTGYLVSSIRNRYVSVPKGFESKAERTNKQRAQAEQHRQTVEASKRKLEREQESKRIDAEVKAYLSKLSKEELEALDAEALREADPEVLQTYESLRSKRPVGAFAETILQHSIRSPYVKRLLGYPCDNLESPSEALV